MYAGSPSFVMTDLRRIQGMETTIEYQRELLSKEFTKNIKSNQIIEEMKKELETSNEKNKHLQEQLQAALKSVKETQIEKGEMNCVLEDFVAAQKALSANQKELLDAQSELVIARNSISDLKAIKTDLESKVCDLIHLML
jgi:Xaa-Pro aminopeptidase